MCNHLRTEISTNNINGIGTKKCLEKDCGMTWEIPITYDAIICEAEQRKQLRRDYSPKDDTFWTFGKRMEAVRGKM